MEPVLYIRVCGAPIHIEILVLYITDVPKCLLSFEYSVSYMLWSIK
jgi:hypothetical protein